jgi:hypothetical protein
MRPALVVGVIALAILLSFSVWAASTHTPTKPTESTGAPKTVKGTSLKAVGAARSLVVIQQDGEPPANVLDAIELPVGAVRGAATDPGVGSSYDQQVQYSIDASQEAVLTFYRSELRALGWSTVTSGAAINQPGQQIVGQLAGEDGFYWQLGVIVAPSTFSASGTTDITQFTLRVLQVDDEGS